MFKDDVKALLNIELSEQQIEQFNLYFKILVEYNKHTNLTRITDEQEVYYKHFFDSLLLAKSYDMTKVKNICDMGSGAGFPSLPLKIIYPHLEVTIVDSLQKRLTFLKQLTTQLNLSRVELVHDRAETFALKKQQSFDIVTARALGSLKLISEMGIPMVSLNGVFIAPKGMKYEEEIVEAEPILKQLKSKITAIDTFELPFEYGKRVNILIKKDKHVSGYPRSYAKMIQK